MIVTSNTAKRGLIGSTTHIFTKFSVLKLTYTTDLDFLLIIICHPLILFLTSFTDFTSNTFISILNTLPLYGSGALFSRISAANCPTTSLLIPLTVILLPSTVTSIPSGA